jgi:4-hydroxythreonine-4-phosphate dehydrogenase
MNSICILLTDHESINEEIIISSYKNLLTAKINKIYFVGCQKKFKKIYKKFNLKKKFRFINVNLKQNQYFEYLRFITNKAIKICKKEKDMLILNMPLNKKKFLKNKFPGFTEFFSYCVNKKKDENMLLYSEKEFSVCPLTTHIEIKNVEKNINKKKIENCIFNIVNFYRKLNKKIEIIVLGLNPHASIDFDKGTKDNMLINKIVKNMSKKKINIKGPVSADTAFMGNLRKKVFIGMYHDQVLIPFKALNKFDGINITIGKKILRLSPDHGTAKNLKRERKYISNKSFLRCLDFCSKKLNV